MADATLNILEPILELRARIADCNDPSTLEVASKLFNSLKLSSQRRASTIRQTKASANSKATASQPYDQTGTGASSKNTGYSSPFSQ